MEERRRLLLTQEDLLKLNVEELKFDGSQIIKTIWVPYRDLTHTSPVKVVFYITDADGNNLTDVALYNSGYYTASYIGLSVGFDTNREDPRLRAGWLGKSNGYSTDIYPPTLGWGFLLSDQTSYSSSIGNIMNRLIGKYIPLDFTELMSPNVPRYLKFCSVVSGSFPLEYPIYVETI